MELIILGENSDDKGTQLEKLTCTILEKYGFKNIVLNEIGSGGQEIDIRAEYIVTSLNGENRKPIICECKAYKASASMSDWLKFLGKVLIEEDKGDCDGYFIALSGVNGNVQGNYRELLTHRNNINLITGESLIAQLSSTFQIISIVEIQKIIGHNTKRRPIEICFCYYDMQIYFLTGFPSNEFTLFSSQGEPLNSNNAIKLTKLISKNTGYQEFIDLQVESKSQVRFTTIKKFIVSFILLKKNGISFQEIENTFKGYDKQLPEIKAVEIEKALKTLLEESLIYTDKDKLKYFLKILSNGIPIEDVVKFYQYLIESIVPLFVMGSELYLKFINDKLLSQICKIQGGILIPKEYKRQCLQILKWSPSALLWSLKPDNMIIAHRSGGKSIYSTLEKEDTSYFLQKLINLLAEDFKNTFLKDYFFNTCQIVELEINNRLKIKTKRKVELDLEYKERTGLAQMTEEYRNQIILVRIFNDQPEPWESSKSNT